MLVRTTMLLRSNFAGIGVFLPSGIDARVAASSFRSRISSRKFPVPQAGSRNLLSRRSV
jgi:hypothetical protein